MIFVYLLNCKADGYEEYHKLACLLIKKAVYDHFGISDVEILKDKQGKPFIGSGICMISVSHCDGLVCIALSNNEVGIDAEKKDRKVKQSVAEKYLRGGDISEWTHLEALAKLDGGGIFTDNKRLWNIPHSFCRFFYNDYVISLCSKNDMTVKTVEVGIV